MFEEFKRVEKIEKWLNWVKIMSIEVKNISKTFTSYTIFNRAENHALNNILN